ncbi:MAG: hypothetical protein ACRBCS_13155 [Cellvibrionaceae bacterium]
MKRSIIIVVIISFGFSSAVLSNDISAVNDSHSSVLSGVPVQEAKVSHLMNKAENSNEFILDRSEEINQLLAIYRGDDLVAQKKQTESLAWSGITDVRVYDEIERLLIKTNEKSTVDRLKNDAISWFLKGLSYSGNAKYVNTIENVLDKTKNSKHRKYSKEALEYLPQYGEWNPIINSTESWNVNESGKVNRFANMIRSDVLRLKELAAKRTYGEKIHSAYLFDVIEKELLAHCADADRTSRFGTTYGFMSKALGASGDKKYAVTIQSVLDRAYNPKLKRLAKKHLREFDFK